MIRCGSEYAMQYTRALEYYSTGMSMESGGLIEDGVSKNEGGNIYLYAADLEASKGAQILGGHAIQHARGYAPLVMRSALVPIVNFSSKIATWVIIGGIALMAAGSGTTVCWIGICLIAMSALFSIVTLPVEYNASARALEWLESSRTLQGVQLSYARESLRWAARTYLVAALSAIATVIYYISMISRRND